MHMSVYYPYNRKSWLYSYSPIAYQWIRLKRKFNVVSNATGLSHSSEYSRWTTRENPHGVRTNPAMDLIVSLSLSLSLSYTYIHTHTRTHTHTHTKLLLTVSLILSFYLQYGSRVIASLQIFILKYLQVTISFLFDIQRTVHRDVFL
jgi:hypothetical protein